MRHSSCQRTLGDRRCENLGSWLRLFFFRHRSGPSQICWRTGLNPGSRLEIPRAHCLSRLRGVIEHLDEHLHLETKALKNINEHVGVSSIILLYLHTPVLNTV